MYSEFEVRPELFVGDMIAESQTLSEKNASLAIISACTNLCRPNSFYPSIPSTGVVHFTKFRNFGPFTPGAGIF